MFDLIVRFKNNMRKFVYYSLALDQSLKNRGGVFILCYHSVSNDNWKYSISYDDLKAQLMYFAKHFNPISLNDVEEYLDDKLEIKTPSFAVTFDDGYKDVFKTRQLFTSLGIKPALFVLSDRKNANRHELATKKAFLSKEEMLTLVKDGWTIGSHSATHANLNNLSQKEIENEIVRSRKRLENELGVAVDYFAYPKGIFADSSISSIKNEGYKLAFTATPGIVSGKDNRYLVPRIVMDRDESIYFVLSYFSLPARICRKFLHFLNKS